MPDTLQTHIITAARQQLTIPEMAEEEASMRRNGTLPQNWGSVEAEIQRMVADGVLVRSGERVSVVPKSVVKQGSLF